MIINFLSLLQNVAWNVIMDMRREHIKHKTKRQKAIVAYKKIDTSTRQKVISFLIPRYHRVFCVKCSSKITEFELVFFLDNRIQSENSQARKSADLGNSIYTQFDH